MATSARTASGDIQIPRVIVRDFNQCVLQTVLDMFGLWETEWFLDTSAGFPWLQRILGVEPPPSPTEAAAIIRQALLSIDGIASVVATATVNRATRAFSYSFEAILNNGSVLTGGSGQKFQIKQAAA